MRTTKSALRFWFVDDVLLSAEGFDDDTGDSIVERHMRHGECFFTQAIKYGVQLKLTKCLWAQTHIQLLGFMLGNGTRQVDPEKAQGLRDWPDPKSCDDIVPF